MSSKSPSKKDDRPCPAVTTRTQATYMNTRQLRNKDSSRRKISEFTQQLLGPVKEKNTKSTQSKSKKSPKEKSEKGKVVEKRKSETGVKKLELEVKPGRGKRKRHNIDAVPSKVQRTHTSVQDLVRSIEDEHSLDDEDFMAILTADSPVWWEHPPDDSYCEEAMFSSPEEKRYFQEIFKHETPTIKTEKDPAETAVSLPSVKQIDAIFINKRNKLENVLGSIKTKLTEPKQKDPIRDVVNVKIEKTVLEDTNEKKDCKENKDVEYKNERKFKTCSESTSSSEDLFLGLPNEDVLKDFENMDIPVETSGASTPVTQTDDQSKDDTTKSKENEDDDDKHKVGNDCDDKAVKSTDSIDDEDKSKSSDEAKPSTESIALISTRTVIPQIDKTSDKDIAEAKINKESKTDNKPDKKDRFSLDEKAKLVKQPRDDIDVKNEKVISSKNLNREALLNVYKTITNNSYRESTKEKQVKVENAENKPIVTNVDTNKADSQTKMIKTYNNKKLQKIEDEKVPNNAETNTEINIRSNISNTENNLESLKDVNVNNSNNQILQRIEKDELTQNTKSIETDENQEKSQNNMTNENEIEKIEEKTNITDEITQTKSNTNSKPAGKSQINDTIEQVNNEIVKESSLNITSDVKSAKYCMKCSSIFEGDRCNYCEKRYMINNDNGKPAYQQSCSLGV